jgi:hypothetical protein
MSGEAATPQIQRPFVSDATNNGCEVTGMIRRDD